MTENYAGRTPDATNTGRGLPYRKARSVPCSAVPRAAHDHASPERTGVLPLLIGPANALAATGASWRWCRDTAIELGVPLVGHGRKRFVPADAFMRALQGVAVVESDAAELADPAAALRARLGLCLVAANDAGRRTNAPLSGGFDAETASMDAPLPARKPRKAAG